MLLSAAGAAMAAASDTQDALFLDDDTLDVVIEAPIATLMAKKPKDEYLPGTFRYSAGGKDATLDVELTTRGHSRHDVCDFPPLWLNFKKSQTGGTLFDEQNKLKLVVHCDRSLSYEQIVLKEYLAYRILNALTEKSFRVRLLRVTYVDTEDKKDDIQRYAFFIEHKNRLASRLGLEDLQIERTRVSAIQPDHLNLTSLFAYLIGNTDFSPIAGKPDDDCCHNYVLLGNQADPIVAVPYDFDQSGLVDPPYAQPAPRFRIKTVRQRVYRGRCVNNQHVEASLQLLQDRREAIFELVDRQVGLQDNIRDKARRYLEAFYEKIDDPRKVEREILKRCV